MFESHSKIEKNLYLLIVFIIIVTSIGGMMEILPLFKQEVVIERVEGMRPHTPLELAGFNIYKREGCYGCHSQQIRPLRDEVERYGHYSLAAESMYDFPFLWGSKRTGPDLARIGEKYSDDWHIEHLKYPRNLVKESIMPNYYFLDTELKYDDIGEYVRVYKLLDTPYTDEDTRLAQEDIKTQLGIMDDTVKVESFKKRYPGAIIRKFYKNSERITELDALVAYLQHLGNKVDLKTNKGRDW